jgi:hypothetical protein
MVEREICIIEFISRPIYLRPESTKELILYNIIKHIEPARVNEPMSPPLFQETAP